MKTVFILSDTHGNRRDIDKLNDIMGETDYIVHLGDTSSDGSYIRAKHPDKTYLVNGNCDPVKLGENELVLEIEGVKVFATHGHLYSAKSKLTLLAARAKELGCAVALYGHTHRAREDFIDGVTLINPGAMSRYCDQSYCYMVINGGKFTHKIVKLNDIRGAIE
ncbi:MAG: metallophosphoesterase [Clostridia bacterium]|nr:metallophosphoesterase [Clostridia bacterium]